LASFDEIETLMGLPRLRGLEGRHLPPTDPTANAAGRKGSGDSRESGNRFRLRRCRKLAAIDPVAVTTRHRSRKSARDDRLDRRRRLVPYHSRDEPAQIEHPAMTDDLFPIRDEAATDIEFVGFETTATIEPAQLKAEIAAPEHPAKPRRRRVVKKRPMRVHPIRVVFDDREFLKLSAQAEGQGMALPDFVRLRALRDPRVRNRAMALPAEDLFARISVMQVTTVRLTSRLSPEIERRINAYFSPDNRVIADPPRERHRLALPARPKILGKLGRFLAELVGPRLPGHRMTPPAGT
jgi:hypothetical protein